MTAKFTAVNPVLPVRNVSQALAYYVDKLGFAYLFQDAVENPMYAGIRRDDVELHLQWHDEASFDVVEKLNLRFVIADVAALFLEYEGQGVFHERTAVRDTDWGTREFAFYDPDGNGLTFYQDL